MFNKALSTLVLLVVLTIAAAGCVPATPAPAPQTAAQSVPQSAPATAIPVALAPATAAPAAAATAAPTAVPAATQPAAATGLASEPYEGISFSYSQALAQTAQGQTLLAEGSADAPWWALSPQHVEIGLAGYVLPKSAQAPRIAVYPVAEFAALSQEAAARIAALQELLKAQPANTEGELPFLPLINARQALHLRVKYLAFQNGQGVSYLTQYNQGPVPLNNNGLFYTFQGLTADGKYYVSAILPVSHDTLPANWESITPAQREAVAGANWTKYVADASAALAAQSDSSFKPGLGDLDTLAQSIAVKP